MPSPKTASVNGNGHHKAEKTSRSAKPKSKTKTKTTRRPRSSSHSESSAEPRLTAAESSRRNSRKSTGPRSEAGKARARYNALKHGMRAESLILPGEDSAEFEMRRLVLHNQIQPRNDIEAELVDHLARNLWMSDRTQRSAVARAEYRIRHEPLEQARAEQQHMAKLGQYLLKDLFRPAGSLPCEREGGAAIPPWWF